MSIDETIITSQLYQYIIDVSLREADILRELSEKTKATFSAYQMQTAPEQMQFLALLAKLLDVRRMLDIGTFTGYSALTMALALPKMQIITCDVNPETTVMAKQYWEKAQVADRIELKLAPALNTLDQLLESGQQNTFDFSYIDADKINIANYYEKSLMLIRSGGVIAIDNVLRHGTVIDSANIEPGTQNIREFNKKLYQDNRVDISLIPFADGVTLARKK